MCLQFGFVFFGQKEIGAKAACKMVMLLTAGVNFIKILWSPFSTKVLCTAIF